MKLNIRQSHTFNQLYPQGIDLAPWVKFLQKWWAEEGEAQVQDISDMLGITFAEHELPAYVHDGPPGASSDPVNVSINCFQDLREVLLHELIHHLLSFNEQGFDEDVESPRFYPKETPSCAIHVVVHAIHAWHYTQQGEDMLMAQDIHGCRKAPDYNRAWEIVQQEGHQAIIDRVKALV